MWRRILQNNIFSLCCENIKHIQEIVPKLTRDNRSKLEAIISCVPLNDYGNIAGLVIACEKCNGIMEEISRTSQCDANILLFMYNQGGTGRNAYQFFITQIRKAYNFSQIDPYDPAICMDWRVRLEEARNAL